MTVSESLTELWKRQEELHLELSLCIEDDDRLNWPVLKHPLVFAVPYASEMNAIYNAQLEHKKQALIEAKKDKEWSSYVFLHERPYRFQAFSKIQNNLTDVDYWDLLGGIWTDSENLWQIPQLSQLLECSRPKQEHFMDQTERQFLNDLPDEFVVYRGHQGRNRRGWSWSLSAGKAAWFVRRFAGIYRDGKVARGLVKKEDVIGFLNGRHEFEIVVPPTKVRLQPPRKLSRPQWLERVRRDCIAHAPLNKRTYTDHGTAHWERVERNGIALVQQSPGTDINAVRLFAYIHDCCREDEFEDSEHGRRAAAFLANNRHIWKLEKVLSSTAYDLLENAITYHNDGMTTPIVTIGACWDADRLDLPRVGITPDLKLLSTTAAKELIWRI
ncbi:MAG: hypothetical protein KGL39_00770 [Patescibacteria group bacterium]|nr:hypothetical protein [Patescibacteria group bacterium]